MIDNDESEIVNSQQLPENSVRKKTVLSSLTARICNFWQIEADDNSTKTARELAQTRTGLASKRTLMAADRTLMAWVRTALSMISFGFTIYKVLESLHRSGREVVIDASPENVGLFLIGLGTISMVMGTIEYWGNIKEIRRTLRLNIIRPAFIMALIISTTGVSIFVSVIAKVI
jgi:putative membrane protein